jgi:hypothetical protein
MLEVNRRPPRQQHQYAASKEVKRRVHRRTGCGRLELLVDIFRHLYNMLRGYLSRNESHGLG